MRAWLALFVVLVAGLAVTADPPASPDVRPPADKGKEDKPREDKPKGSKETGKDAKGWALAPGNDLPGPFHPFYVSGPWITKLRQEAAVVKENKKIGGRFHCPVSHHGNDPMVLLFIREVRFSDALKDLLKRLDTTAAKNPNVRLGVAAVFVSDELNSALASDLSKGGKDDELARKNDDLRDDLARRLEDLAIELKLEHVGVCLDAAKGDLQKWQIDRDDPAMVVVLTRDCAVVASEAVPRDALTPEKVDKLRQQVAEKFGAVRR